MQSILDHLERYPSDTGYRKFGGRLKSKSGRLNFQTQPWVINADSSEFHSNWFAYLSFTRTGFLILVSNSPAPKTTAVVKTP